LVVAALLCGGTSLPFNGGRRPLPMFDGNEVRRSQLQDAGEPRAFNLDYG
jgi:hypothetical protein